MAILSEHGKTLDPIIPVVLNEQGEEIFVQDLKQDTSRPKNEQSRLFKKIKLIQVRSSDNPLMAMIRLVAMALLMLIPLCFFFSIVFFVGKIAFGLMHLIFLAIIAFKLSSFLGSFKKTGKIR